MFFIVNFLNGKNISRPVCFSPSLLLLGPLLRQQVFKQTGLAHIIQDTFAMSQRALTPLPGQIQHLTLAVRRCNYATLYGS